MQLSQIGESRVRGYLFVLERSLRSFLSTAQVDDAVREIESHIRDRVAESDATPDERTALERILTHLGSPLTVARAYSAEMSAEEAVATGRIAAVTRSLFYLAAAGVREFFTVILLLIGYTVGLGLVILAPLKIVAPANVGLIVVRGIPVAIGAVFPVPEDAVIMGGYWIVPVTLLAGAAALIFTHRAARSVVGRWLARLRADKLRPAMESGTGIATP